MNGRSGKGNVGTGREIPPFNNDCNLIPSSRLAWVELMHLRRSVHWNVLRRQGNSGKATPTLSPQ
jgi:hypothetical protein